MSSIPRSQCPVIQCNVVMRCNTAGINKNYFCYLFLFGGENKTGSDCQRIQTSDQCQVILQRPVLTKQGQTQVKQTRKLDKLVGNQRTGVHTSNNLEQNQKNLETLKTKPKLTVAQISTHIQVITGGRCTTACAAVNYSGDLKSRLVWILNGQKEVGLQMVRISNGI